MFYTERLMFRAVNLDSDLNALGHWLNNKEYRLALLIEAPKPMSLTGVRKLWENIIKDAEEKERPFFAICERPADNDMPECISPHENIALKDGKPRYPLIGILKVNVDKSNLNRCASLGIAFDNAHVGRGFGREAMEWACEYVFDSLGFHRVQLRVRTENHRAIKCYEKVGFVHEGISRECFFYDGKWCDECQMAILEHQWRERKGVKS